jgi:hypothetical protein
MLTIYTKPRLQAISYAIMLARLAYDGKLAANLRRADGESRNAPQFRVQAEEITSRGTRGQYLPAAAEVPTAPDWPSSRQPGPRLQGF